MRESGNHSFHYPSTLYSYHVLSFRWHRQNISSIKLISIHYRLFRSIRWRGVLLLLPQESRCRMDDSWDLWQKELTRKGKEETCSSQSKAKQHLLQPDKTFRFWESRKIEKYKLKQNDDDLLLMFTQSIIWSFRFLYSYCNDDPGVYFQWLNFSFFYFINSLVWFWKDISLKFIFPTESSDLLWDAHMLIIILKEESLLRLPDNNYSEKKNQFSWQWWYQNYCNLRHLPWSFPMLSQTMIKKKRCPTKRVGR